MQNYRGKPEEKENALSATALAFYNTSSDSGYLCFRFYMFGQYLVKWTFRIDFDNF